MFENKITFLKIIILSICSFLTVIYLIFRPWKLIDIFFIFLFALTIIYAFEFKKINIFFLPLIYIFIIFNFEITQAITSPDLYKIKINKIYKNNYTDNFFNYLISKKENRLVIPGVYPINIETVKIKKYITF
jgi:hypothetical protein